MEVFVIIPYINRGVAPVAYHYSRACPALQGHSQVERYLFGEVFEAYPGIKACSACQGAPRYVDDRSVC